MSEYTKGNWELIPGDEQRRPIVGVFETNSRIADIGDRGQTAEERHANGLLIAAAKDMYEALKKIIALTPIQIEAVTIAGKAIDKAEGK